MRESREYPNPAASDPRCCTLYQTKVTRCCMHRCAGGQGMLHARGSQHPNSIPTLMPKQHI
eukprot:5956413-Amphidinium_carterae.2